MSDEDESTVSEESEDDGGAAVGGEDARGASANLSANDSDDSLSRSSSVRDVGEKSGPLHNDDGALFIYHDLPHFPFI